MQQSTKVETRVVGNVGIMDLSGEVTSFSEVEMHKAYDTSSQAICPLESSHSV